MTSFASFSGAGSYFEALEMNEEVLGYANNQEDIGRTSVHKKM
jgi:hypothetical protein